MAKKTVLLQCPLCMVKCHTKKAMGEHLSLAHPQWDIDEAKLAERLVEEGLSPKQVGRVTAQATFISRERQEKSHRLYADHPPRGTADDQTTAFAEVLKRLYQLEDKTIGPGDGGQRALYCEARAICERHLPTTLVAIMRKRHGQ